MVVVLILAVLLEVLFLAFGLSVPINLDSPCITRDASRALDKPVLKVSIENSSGVLK